VEQATPAGEGKGDGAVLSWGRAGAVQGTRGEGWGGLNHRGGAQQEGDGRRQCSWRCTSRVEAALEGEMRGGMT
jgi:hypothetical protein